MIEHWAKNSSSSSKIELRFWLKQSWIAVKAISRWVQSLWEPFSYKIYLYLSKAWWVSLPAGCSFGSISKFTTLSLGFLAASTYVAGTGSDTSIKVSDSFSQRVSLIFSGRDSKSFNLIHFVCFCTSSRILVAAPRISSLVWEHDGSTTSQIWSLVKAFKSSESSPSWSPACTLKELINLYNKAS